MAYVNIPKDLTNIKTKFIGNFTKRQCVCFGLGVAVGIVVYCITKPLIGLSAFYVFIGVLCPFFFFGIAEKDGLPYEKYLWHIIKHRLIRPQVRIYKSENIYDYYSSMAKLERKEGADNATKKRTKAK